MKTEMINGTKEEEIVEIIKIEMRETEEIKKKVKKKDPLLKKGI